MGLTLKIVIFDTEEWKQGAFDELKELHEVQLPERKLAQESVGKYADTNAIFALTYSDISHEVL
ncbi:MAG: hypothetical protein R6U51_09545 [Anaerolineales bacterium]